MGHTDGETGRVEAEPSVPKNVKVPNTEELASVKKGLVPSEEESIEKKK